eukprot:15454173-Alexandrium_andersonii.AAC.1
MINLLYLLCSRAGRSGSGGAPAAQLRPTHLVGRRGPAPPRLLGGSSQPQPNGRRARGEDALALQL